MQPSSNMQLSSSNMTIATCKLTFIGGGNMAQALMQGLKQRAFNMSDVTVVELDADKRAQLSQALGVNTTESLSHVTDSDVVILAVKPQQLKAVATALSPHLSKQLLISVAAGIRATDLSRCLHHADTHHAKYTSANPSGNYWHGCNGYRECIAKGIGN
jgi:pyrroline-5-carboxylate reductase